MDSGQALRPPVKGLSPSAPPIFHQPTRRAHYSEAPGGAQYMEWGAQDPYYSFVNSL